jgi:photosystem II stability/assembly factor-like uncharacterized protein
MPPDGVAVRSLMLKCFSALMCALLLLSACASAQWRSLGPYGGNARALAFNPRYPDHVLLGSGAGTLFESLDNGRSWRPFAHLGAGDELMLENVAFDPLVSSTIYVAGWNVSGSGGGFFVTRDGGRSWSEPAALKGKSIQALALSESDPRILIVGALDGLYRSRDSGTSWERITPTGHPDLKNFESVAIDPRDPNVIYAGTWHLPWKTSDGGATWSNIKRGVIDDSDVFSIILDRSNPDTVFASACSGIYKSDDGGRLFRKVEGIPGSARRTRVLQQDSADPKTVYAGTTEGLFKTSDGGVTFRRITPPDFILNDVLVDPRDPQRVLIATDRGGVFTSDDAGASFQASNDGFSERQITTVVADPKDAHGLYAGVLNDKEFGGVFHSQGGFWKQMSDGLGGRDVFDLGWSRGGQLAAATNHGIFLFDAKVGSWHPSRAELLARRAAPAGRAVARKKGKKVQARSSPVIFDGRVSALAMGGRRWYAATGAGILHSDDDGVSWSGGPGDPQNLGTQKLGSQNSFISVSAHDDVVVAASVRQVWYSANYGHRWTRQLLPPEVMRVYSVSVTGDGEVWAATAEGALRWIRKSRDEGSWEHVTNGLPARQVTSIREAGGLLLAAVADSRCWYVSRDRGQSWKASAAAEFVVSGALKQGDTLYVTTRHHGVLALEPEARLKQHEAWSELR